MKSKLTTTLLAAFLGFSSAHAIACGIDNGAFFQTIGTMPSGTFGVALAINEAKENQEIVVSEKHTQRLDILLWQFQQRLKSHYTGEEFDITLYDIAGNHFLNIIADGKVITSSAHELPEDGQSVIFGVTDASVLFALASDAMTFTQAQSLGIWRSEEGSEVFNQLLHKAFG
ncbi:hypothetical protein [uncultured Vibrio sp.]|uniref:hypothetical protein n=1 Tax=uncultured Vibrio sp. TaxID=114054 RepID=UPI00091FCBD1|nr:hypothetical protein [uncultured Vibrio sp.]OIQ24871.1 MAG: hypothetical protein BM561_08265 [Vibrio sp. MedPE-SWchi]